LQWQYSRHPVAAEEEEEEDDDDDDDIDLTSLLVFGQTATLPLAAYLSRAGFSLLQCPATLVTGFSSRHFPASAFVAARH